MTAREFLLGRRLRTEAEQDEQIGPITGVPVLGLDALASASYGPEAALTVMLPLGALAVDYIGFIVAATMLLLTVVFISYRQTIPAYPQGGGSFTVARENLGPRAGLLAASALAVDYILNVAVAISAGVGAIVSMRPALQPHTLSLCLAILVLMALINLRGVRTAGLLLVVPTYLFVGCLGATIAIAAVEVLGTSGVTPNPSPAPAALPATALPMTAWLVLRAFASGCTALTGVEAVSNAVPIFRPPTVKNARRTLALIVGILGASLAGIAFLVHRYDIQARTPGEAGYESVISQAVSAVMGRGWFYYLSMTSVLLVLVLSANTSFADFPRVCRVLAQHKFLPDEFAHRGGRLVFSTGIVLLALLAGVLLIVFNGVTDRLIPLFAVGAFLAFTLSELGMVVHWRRSGAAGRRRAMVINACGAAATAMTLVIIVVSKFVEGAWITVLVIPPLIWLFSRIRRYHETLAEEIQAAGPIDVGRGHAPPVIVIPVKRMDRAVRKALSLALEISPDVHGVQILDGEAASESLHATWDRLVAAPARAAGLKPPELIVFKSPLREFFEPVLGALQRVGVQYPHRMVAVMLPEIVERRWYHFLYRHRLTLLKALLVLRGGPRIVIITIPWYLHEASDTAPGRGAQGRAADPVIAGTVDRDTIQEL
jgi:amino acid transporter